MPSLSPPPSWIPLSFSNFDKYKHVIKRWVSHSTSKLRNTEANIRNLFIKIFYIAISESVLKPEYSSFLNPEFLKKYKLKRSQFPQGLFDFTDLFDIIHIPMADQQVLSFYIMLVHRVFKWVTDKLHIAIKSDIKTQFTLTSIKLYELKMFVNLCYTDFREYNESNLRYGGIPAIFAEYLSSLCLTEGKYTMKKHSPQKQSGSVFTPLWIIQMIGERIRQPIVGRKIGTNIDVADISVGYGGFLENFLPQNQDKHQKYSLHGFDADPFKIDIVKLNHAILYKHRCASIRPNNLYIQDSIINPLLKKYDILVGNPPWGAKINKTRLLQVEDLSPFAVKQYDSYGLFLVRNILSVKDDGIVYLVLPETILLNPNYKELRKYILEKTTIVDIVHLGEDIFEGVNMPAIILGLQKKVSEPAHEVNIFLNIKRETKLEEITQPDKSSYILRSQMDFLNNESYVFDIFTNNEDRKIIEQINQKSCYKLKELVNNSRGVEIGKKGEVIQCYHCNVWMPVPVWSLDSQRVEKYAKCNVCKKKIYLTKLKKRDKLILDNPPESDEEVPYSKFLVGNNIQKYKLTGNKFIILQRRGIKYKPAKIYKQEKILIRKTSKQLLATIDYSNSYTIQVIYQLSLKEDYKSHPFLLEFLLGVISSHIMHFYYSKKFQYANRKSFPHHLQKNILSLPIPKIKFPPEQDAYSDYYTQIVFSALMLMNLAYFEEFQSTFLPLATKLTVYFKDKKKILNALGLMSELKENLLDSIDMVKAYFTKLENVKDTMEYFQKVLDSSVEQLFLALE